MVYLKFAAAWFTTVYKVEKNILKETVFDDGKTRNDIHISLFLT